jgi:hypothetical protein
LGGLKSQKEVVCVKAKALLMTIFSFSALICVNPMIDPSAALRTPVRAGPNGAGRVLGDKDRRLTEIFLKYARFFRLPFVECITK